MIHRIHGKQGIFTYMNGMIFMGFHVMYMDVSENSATPKSSILIGFSIIFTIHFGGLILFLVQHPYRYIYIDIYIFLLIYIYKYMYVCMINIYIYVYTRTHESYGFLRIPMGFATPPPTKQAADLVGSPRPFFTLTEQWGLLGGFVGLVAWRWIVFLEKQTERRLKKEPQQNNKKQHQRVRNLPANF